MPATSTAAGREALHSFDELKTASKAAIKQAAGVLEAMRKQLYKPIIHLSKRSQNQLSAVKTLSLN